MEQSAVAEITFPPMRCMDCDDMAPSWVSPINQPLVKGNQSDSRHGDSPQDQDSYLAANISFPSRFSVALDSESQKLDAYEDNEGDCDEYLKSDTDRSTFVEHGFSFGGQSFSKDKRHFWHSECLRRNLSMESNEEEDSDVHTKKQSVNDIYRSTGDIPGALLYKTERERPALSQKIGSIGRAGQNLSLGHILGRAEDESMLIPSRIQVIETHFILDETSPVQTDIKWCPPDNASQFQQLVYDVETCNMSSLMCKGEELSYFPVSRVHHPVIRIYRSESSLFFGRHRVKRTNKDTIFKLRVRAQGRLMGKTGPVQVWMSRSQSGCELSHWLAGEWSSDIHLTWVGCDNQGQASQLTSL